MLAFGFKPTSLLIHISILSRKEDWRQKFKLTKFPPRASRMFLQKRFVVGRLTFLWAPFSKAASYVRLEAFTLLFSSFRFLFSCSCFPFPVNKLNSNALLLQVAKREEAIHKLKIEKLALQEQQQKAEDNVSILCL